MPVSEESLRDLAALAGVVLAQHDVESTLQEVCRIAVRAVPAAEGASITTLETGRPLVIAASDDWARELDELQYTEREGPCLDCTRTGTVFRVRDLADDPRWPSYGPRAVQTGVRSTVSLPMANEGRNVGALNLYARTPDAFSTEDVTVGEVIAAHSALAMQVASAFFGHRDLAAQLRHAMESRPVIEQAKGILMARHGVTADQAFVLLRGASQRRNTKLREVADEVVSTGQLEGA